MKRGVVAGSSVAASTMVFLALFRGSGPAPPPAAPATSGSVQSVRLTGASSGKQPVRAGQKKRPAEGPWKASRDRFAGWKAECPVSSLEKTTNSKDIASLGNVILKLEKRGSRKAGLNQNDVRSKLWCIPKGESVRALIAILPDPMQTNMQLLFDRMIDGIQMAAESAGYVIDHYWVPWERPQSIEYADYSLRKAVLQDQKEKQKQPGLLLFRLDRRMDAKQPSTLFIFLVSDTSTTGINGMQFYNAASYVKQVCGDGQIDCAHDPVTIIGPTFSGSLASLRRLTERRSENFYAYSGTVSSACAASNENLPLGRPEEKDCDSHVLPDRARYHASNGVVESEPELHENLFFFPLMRDTENALTAVEGWVKKIDKLGAPRANGPCGYSLAIFSEAGTTYGRVASPQPPTGRSGESQSGETDPPCHITFEYPREISSLRNAYPGEGPTDPSGGASNNTGFTYLPFNLADRESNRTDEPPDFSRSHSPLSKEAVLMSSAAELRRRHIKYAGIVGSNVLDIVFIAKFLRKACPDIRLFVLHSDLLFERDLDNSSYIGTLTFTTYPLMVRNVDWLSESPEDKRQQLPRLTLPFVDQDQEGEYNAALFAISQPFPKPCQGETAPTESRGLVDPSDPSQTFIPCKSELPLWLTTVGYGGYWPVALLAPESNAAKADPELRSEDFSPAWTAFAALVSLFALIHIAGLLTSFWPKLGVNIFPLFGPGTDRRFFFAGMATATLATALGMLLALLCPMTATGTLSKAVQMLKTPAWSFSLERGAALGWIALILWGLMLILLLFCILLASGVSLPKGAHKLRLQTKLYLFLVFCAAAAAVWLWLALQDEHRSHYGFFFAYRSVHLATGVSPLTPMIPLLAGIYCWALFESLRLKFHDDERPKLRRSDTVRTLDLPGGLTEQSVAKSVNDFLLRKEYLVALWLVFLLWFCSLHPIHPFQIFELPRYGFIYEFLFALGVFLMLSSGFRLGQIWSDLKKLLAELDQSPVTPAFKRIREQSWSPIWDFGVTERGWTNINRCIERMRQIVGSRPKPPQYVIDKVEYLAHLATDEQERNERLGSKNEPSHAIQVSLQELLRRTMINLEHYWSEGDACTAESGNNDEQNEIEMRSHNEQNEIETRSHKKIDPYTRQIRRLEEFVALRYVAFIGGVLYQIRLLIIIVAVLFTLVLLSLNIYSFEPHQSLIWSFTAMFAVIGFLIVKVLREVHRDNVLSRVTGTKANELGLDFYVRVAAFGVAPLAALLATHFPAIGRYLVSFLQPGLEAVK